LSSRSQARIRQDFDDDTPDREQFADPAHRRRRHAIRLSRVGADHRRALRVPSCTTSLRVCLGDGRPYNTALITLGPVVADGRPGDDPDLVSAVQSAVDAANEQLSRVEQIKRFSVIDGEWHPDGDELTPTPKLKRRAVAAKYAAEIEAMCAQMA
jgi:hypothetical protein